MHRQRARRRDRRRASWWACHQHRRVVRSVVAGVAAGASLLSLGALSAVFASTTGGPASSYTAADLSAFDPTAATATRTAATTCLVSWTPVASPPAGLTYDITDGAGSTLATTVSGTSASVTVPATAVTPVVLARRGGWVSTVGRATASACLGYPDAPGGLTLTPSHTQVMASWTAPAGNGGTVTSYSAVGTPSDGSLPTRSCTATAPTTTCTLTGLTNGVTYTVAVTATSAVGTGPAATGSAIPYPSALMSGSALKLWLDGADTATLFAGSSCSGAAASSTVGCWLDKSTAAAPVSQATAGQRPTLSTVAGRSVPSFDGSSTSLGATVAALPTGSADSTMFVVSGLTDPAPASSGWRVVAGWGTPAGSTGRQVWKEGFNNNVFGDLGGYTGAVSGTSWTSAPLVVAHSVTSSGSSISTRGQGGSLSSTVPATSGTGFTVGRTPDAADQYWQGPVAEVVVLGVVTSTERRTVEEYLSRKWSSAITPDAPTAATATASGVSGITASWTAPAWDGGSAITSYTAYTSPGGQSCTATAPATSCTVTGVAGGTANVILVRANNASGAGPFSDSSSPVTLPTVPGAPTSVSGTAGSGSASISWTAPASDGGSAITSYTATASPGGATCTATAPTTSCTITGLTNGTTYSVTVTATNAVGTGSDSSAASVTPAAAGNVLAFAGTSTRGQGGAGASPTLPKQADSATSWSQVSAGGTHSCGVRTNGTLWCWGTNSSGQLGLGDTTSRETPVQVGSVTTWSAVSAGDSHSCALRTDGTLWCWGANGNGRLGDNTTTQRTSPTQVGSDTTWNRVSTGTSHTCATRTDGTLWCWGSRANGRLGLGATTSGNVVTPAQVGSGTTWNGISAGSVHTCATQTDGTAWCWGSGGNGRIGDSATTQRTVPTQVSGGVTTWNRISAGGSHTCATRTNGTVWCWGDNSSGQLGDGTTTQRTSPTQVGSVTTWNGVTSGSAHTCATRTDGTGWCWGANSDGRLGNGSATDTTSPAQISGVSTFAASGVTAGAAHSCGVTSGNTVWCWGAWSDGRLGWSPQSTLFTASGSTTGWADLTHGLTHGCAVRSTGTLWCWGSNSSGQLGLGDIVDRASPVQVGSDTTWAQVDAGGSSTCGRRTDGTLWCWGDNSGGQVGDGTTTQRTSPVQVGSATTWAQVSVGNGFACATRADATLWCWGSNGSSQLGDGGTTSSSSPVQIGAGSSWGSVTTGDVHACAVRTDGTAWCWGANTSGEIGDGTATTRTTPTQVSGGATDWTALSAGESYTCGLRSPGTAWCWGSNFYYQLAVNGPISSSTPVRISGATTYTTVAAGQRHVCAVRSDDSLWCWGVNPTGHLGMGDTADRREITRVWGISGTGLFPVGGEVGTLVLAGAAPSAPTGVSANATTSAATVSWTAPTYAGVSAVTSYTATAVPGGATCTASPPSTSCTITGLTDDTTYTVSVTASNASATSASSTSYGPVTPVPGSGATSDHALVANSGTLTAAADVTISGPIWSWSTLSLPYNLTLGGNATAQTGAVTLGGTGYTAAVTGNVTAAASTATLAGTSSTITGDLATWGNITLSGTVNGNATTATGAITSCTSVRDACLTSTSVPSTATPATMNWSWNSGNYASATDHAGPAAFASWAATNAGAISGAHTVFGDTTIGSNLVISGDTTIYVQGGSLTFNGTISTTSSSSVKLSVVADGLVTFNGSVTSGTRLRVGVYAFSDITVAAASTLRGYLYSQSGGIALNAATTLTYVPVRDPGFS